MARENQGLQIALIISVMLALLFAVFTFVFYRQYEEASENAQIAKTEASKSRSANSVLSDQCIELKRQIGFKDSQELDEIGAQFNQDMQTFGATYPEGSRFYSPLLGYMHNTIQKQNTKLAGLETDLEKLRKEYLAREASKDGQYQEFRETVKTVEQSKTNLVDGHKTELARIDQDQRKIQKDAEDAQKQAGANLANKEQELKAKNDELLAKSQQYDKKSAQLKEVTSETFETPDGEIRWVDQGNGIVWINLGRADALRRQITFSVYPIDTSNLAKGVKKADIEVTQIIGAHLAEARILEDKISEPIMPGDKIYTPVWAAGAKRRFALTGFMDIDGDGKSDLDTVINVIKMNNGIVDCWIDEEGNQHKKMTLDTDYVVLGEKPDEKTRKEVTDANTRMTEDAKMFGIPKISLEDLMRQMGWKNQTPVVTFGRGSNPNDFRPKPPEGLPKVSRGNVSGLFKPRRSPAGGTSKRGGAY